MKQTALLSWRFDLALQLALGLHRQQVRKGTTIPYISHLLAVCSLVLEAGGDEDQAIAALLHDAVEDQGGSATLETIRHLFGDRVATAVESCSDSVVTDAAKKAPWRQRKEKYLAHLQHANEDARLIAAADKLHNVRAVLKDFREMGDQVWSRFNAPKQEQLWYYSALVDSLPPTGTAQPIIEELAREVEELKELSK